jgi:hypothetical protein|tara:strand:- start:1915 stop:2973 length:1059 start_codon:yes stop_codon:yes gene_type:complete
MVENIGIRHLIYENMNMPKINEWASAILDPLVLFLNEGVKIEGGVSLNWESKREFNAYASERSGGGKVIGFTYDVAKEICVDADHLFCILKTPWGRPITSIGVHRETLAELRPSKKFPYEKAKKMVSELAITWIFFHEAGHLIEHHESFKINMPRIKIVGDETVLPEIDGEEGLGKNSRASWISHALEISADYQATRFIFRKLAASGCISEFQIWSLAVGVCNLFYRFGSDGENEVFAYANGSHPSPVVRFYFFYTNIKHMVMDPAYKGKVLFCQNETRLDEILLNALNTASSYHNLRGGSGPIPKMTLAIFDGGEFYSYLSTLKKVWSGIRPEIEKNIERGAPTSPMSFGE